MTDPDDFSETSSAPSSTPSTRPQGGKTRPMLWLLLVTGAAGTTATKGACDGVAAAFGAATLASATALIIQHYRNRRR
ncbi:hypothetical protein [Actinomadura macra]|uniref:hypothetical protein n=1 Tax=Actinomadura macra TaxID=46164 RepID=UPI00082A5F08|nr:hypothetical protein [Actinomadura macra]